MRHKRKAKAAAAAASPAKKAKPSKKVASPKRAVSPPPPPCPVGGCSGSGSLDGVAKSHSTELACPAFHRLSVPECRELGRRRAEDLEPVIPGPEAKASASPVKALTKARAEARRSLALAAPPEAEPGQALEPSLSGVSSEADLGLFRKAQAAVAAAAATEEEAAGEGTLVELGSWGMRGWFPSEYPERLRRLPRLFVCPGCLKCVATRTLLTRHRAKCVWSHPPGNELYRDGAVSFWEVDGRAGKLYCQNLCLLAKLFLDHKTLYYDVVPFLFYVMTRPGPDGAAEILGYFSKEKESMMNCNLSCILTLPPFQRKGYGRLLIQFSWDSHLCLPHEPSWIEGYLLSQRDGRIGSPEHPLSDLGLLAYRNYWSDVILESLREVPPGHSFSFKDLSLSSGIHMNDIVSTLQWLGFLKYWKGEYIIKANPEKMGEWERREAKQRRLDPDKLHWDGPPVAVEPQ